MIGLGLRLDVMNCEVDKRHAYELIGYRCLEGFDFVHSHLGTVSRVMILSADPKHSFLFQESFGTLSNPVSLTDMLSSFHLTLRAKESQPRVRRVEYLNGQEAVHESSLDHYSRRLHRPSETQKW